MVSLAEAREHWLSAAYGKPSLRAETAMILNYLEAASALRT